MSIVHGGPGPRCFGLPVYDSLIKGVSQASVSVNDVYDVDLRHSLEALKNAKTIQEAEQLISDVISVILRHRKKQIFVMQC